MEGGRGAGLYGGKARRYGLRRPRPRRGVGAPYRGVGPRAPPARPPGRGVRLVARMEVALTADFQPVPTRVRLLWWQERGLSFTASGYGRRIPTSFQVQLPGSPVWRRVYCCIYSNSGTCYVEGPPVPGSKRLPWIVIRDY